MNININTLHTETYEIPDAMLRIIFNYAIEQNCKIPEAIKELYSFGQLDFSLENPIKKFVDTSTVSIGGN